MKLLAILIGFSLTFALATTAAPAATTTNRTLQAEVSEAEARALFTYLKSQRHIPFDYIETGCIERDHEMGRLLASRGIQSRQIWAYGELAVFGWNKHVAPVVTVRTGTGDLVELVLDPSISTGPSPISLWLGRMGVAECTFFRPDHPLVSRADTPDPSCLYTVNDRSEWQLWNDELARKNLEALARYRAMPVVPRP